MLNPIIGATYLLMLQLYHW